MAVAQERYRIGEAFDIPDFKQLSLLAQDETLLPDLQIDLLDNELKAGSNGSQLYNDGSSLIDLELPPLDDLNIDHASSLDGESELSYSDVDLPPLDIINETTEPVEDVWQINKDLPALSTEPRLLSWERFTKPSAAQTKGPAYISEAGSAAFDAVLTRAASSSAHRVGAGRPVQAKPFLRSLCQLGLGRASIFFPWDEEEHAFKKTPSDGRPSGYSLECSQSMIESMMRCGTSRRTLQAFIDKTRSLANENSTTISLSAVIDTILTAIDVHMAGAETAFQSLLQVQSAFEPVQSLVNLAKELVDSIKDATTDDNIMNRLIETLNKHDNSTSNTVGVCRQVLRRITWHLFRKIERLIGLSTSPGLDMHLLQMDQLPHAEDVADTETVMSLPDCVTENEKQLIRTTLRCLAYLQDHHKDHSFGPGSETCMQSPKLDLEFQWQDVDRLQEKANEYQRSLVQALAHSSQYARQADEEETDLVSRQICYDPPTSAFDLDLEILDHEPQYETPHLHEGISCGAPIQDKLLNVVQNFLKPSSDNDDISGYHNDDIVQEPTPPMSLVPSLSLYPILKTQHDFLSYSALHCVLHKHDLLSHFHKHYSFALFGSGLFVALLRNVLFSAETETTERQRNVLRTGGSSQGAMGLHLGTGDRQQWPSASSEVRLALMNVLADVWQEEATTCIEDQARSMPIASSNTTTSAAQRPAPTTQSADLSSSISFTIRTQLTETSIAKLLDPNSVHALDFLALTYTPPAALLPLFAPRVLAQYDRIFTLQLRLLRVSASLASVHKHTRILAQQQAPGQTDSLTSLALHLHHAMLTFHTTVLSHTRHAAIDAPWRAFLARLHAARAACEDPIPPASRLEAQPQSSLDTLAALHESTLFRILGGLLLRKKQGRLMEALESVWDTILGAEVGLGSLVGRGDDHRGGKGLAEEVEPELRQIYRGFEARKVEFVRRCEGSLDAGGQEQVSGDDAEVRGVTRDLVAALEWNEPGKGMTV